VGEVVGMRTAGSVAAPPNNPGSLNAELHRVLDSLTSEDARDPAVLHAHLLWLTRLVLQLDLRGSDGAQDAAR
jgi:hypothetical protein